MPKEEAREQAFWTWSKEFAVPRPNSSMVPIFWCSRNTRTRKVKTTRCLFASVKADGRKLLLTGFGTQVSGGIPWLTMYGVSCNQGGQEFVLYYTITILYYELSIAHWSNTMALIVHPTCKCSRSSLYACICSIQTLLFQQFFYKVKVPK